MFLRLRFSFLSFVLWVLLLPCFFSPSPSVSLLLRRIFAHLCPHNPVTCSPPLFIHPCDFYSHQRPNLSYSVPPPLILFRLPIPSPLLPFTYILYVESLSSPLSLSRFFMALLHSRSPISHIYPLSSSSRIYHTSHQLFLSPIFFLSPLSYLHSLFLDYRINSPLTLPVPLPLPLSVNSVPSTPS